MHGVVWRCILYGIGWPESSRLRAGRDRCGEVLGIYQTRSVVSYCSAAGIWILPAYTVILLLNVTLLRHWWYVFRVTAVWLGTNPVCCGIKNWICCRFQAAG